LSLLPDAKPMEDLGEVKSVDNQGICDGNSQTSRKLCKTTLNR